MTDDASVVDEVVNSTVLQDSLSLRDGSLHGGFVGDVKGYEVYSALGGIGERLESGSLGRVSGRGDDGVGRRIQKLFSEFEANAPVGAARCDVKTSGTEVSSAAAYPVMNHTRCVSDMVVVADLRYCVSRPHEDLIFLL